jgi:YcxB-like protein
MQDSFTIAQDLTRAEYVRFSLYLLPRMKVIRRLFIFVACVSLVAGLLGVVVPGKNETITLLTIVRWFLPMVVLLLFFFIATLLGSLYVYRIRPHLVKGISYRFSTRGMERIGAKLEAVVPWIDFLRIKESDSFFIIYVRENKVENVHVIQKRMFASGEEAAEFKKLVERNMPL